MSAVRRAVLRLSDGTVFGALMSVADAATFLERSRSAVCQSISDGTFPFPDLIVDRRELTVPFLSALGVPRATRWAVGGRCLAADGPDAHAELDRLEQRPAEL